MELSLLDKSMFGFYGILIFLTVYMLFQYLQNYRQSFYLYYAGYVLFTLFVFEPHLTPIKNAYVHFLEWTVILFYFLFLDSFLNISQASPFFRKAFRWYKYGFAALFMAQTGMIVYKEAIRFSEVLETITGTIDEWYFYVSFVMAIYMIYEIFKLKNILSRYILFGILFVTIGLALNRIYFRRKEYPSTLDRYQPGVIAICLGNRT